MFETLIVSPINFLLNFFYSYTGNFGVAIILLTLFIKFILLPFAVPTYASMKKQKELKPVLDKLKEKYKDDKKKLTEEQMKLFKEHGINPASGCLTQIVTILVLIGLYQVIQNFTNETASVNNSFEFLIFNLKEIDNTYILPLLAGILTLITSAMMLPEFTLEEKLIKKVSKDPMEEMAYTMQTQMTVIAPVMTFLVGLQIPAGLTLYLVVSSLFQIPQQYYLLGNFGGLVSYYRLYKSKLFKK